MIRRAPTDRPRACDLLHHHAFNPIFDTFLYSKLRKYKEDPKPFHGFRGDDILQKLKFDIADMKNKLSKEEFVIPLNLILVAVTNCDFHFSKFNAFKLLISIVENLHDQIVLERIIPIFLKFTRFERELF